MIPEGGEAFTHDEIYALWGGFGANAGVRLETKASFDRWPFLGQVAGYEVRTHETFRIECVETDRFVADLPPHEDPGIGGESGYLTEPNDHQAARLVLACVLTSLHRGVDICRWLGI